MIKITKRSSNKLDIIKKIHTCIFHERIRMAFHFFVSSLIVVKVIP